MPTEVTDPALLQQLNAPQNEVTDPELLKQLNAPAYTPHDNYVPPDMNATVANSPLAPGGFLRNLWIGENEASNSLFTGLKERYYQLTGNQPALTALQSQIASDRQLFAPANATGGTKLGNFMGQIAPGAAASLIPGMQGYAGAALIGGLQGAAQPTTENESALLNTGVGLASAPLAKFAGDMIGGALTRSLTGRASNTALANAVGSDASKLTDQAIGERSAELNALYRAVRSPNAMASVDPAMVQNVANGLDASSRSAFEANPNVSDLLGHITGRGEASAEQLGNISTGLRQDAYGAINSEGGNRELGRALYALRDQVESRIRSTISDPELAAQYAAAPRQYGLLQDVSTNPTLLNPTTGRAKMLNIANYLNRNFTDYSDASNKSPLYLAAKLAQGASDEGKAPPPFDLAKNLGVPWFLYKIGQNYGEQGTRTAATAAALAPLSRGLRTGLPVASAFRYGLPGLTLGTEGALLPYLEQ